MRKLFVLMVTVLLSVNSFAQLPQKMSYQAVIRNSSDVLVTNTQIGMQISILQGSTSGTVVYSETQTPTTNTNGLISIEIGAGAGFSTIDWSAGPYFIKTEADLLGGTAYTISGTSELLSVPYALHAKTAENIVGGITETDPIFGASVARNISNADVTNWNNKLDTEIDGDTTNELQVLSISNDTIYLSNGGYVKLPSDFDGQYSSLIGTPTNVSDFVNDAGYLTSFSEIDGDTTNEIQVLSLSNDTIYLSNGGFVKLPVSNAWSLLGDSGTVDSTNFIGTTDNVPLNFRVNNQKAGRIDSNSDVFLGYQAGSNNSAIENTAIGFQALQLTNNPLSLANTAIGYKALKANNGLGRNTAVGTHALLNNTTGEWNTGIGAATMQNTTTGSHNTALGGSSLSSNETGSGNVAIGGSSLMNNKSGNYGTAIGFNAMLYANNTSIAFTNYNVAVGFEALRGSTSASANTGNNNTAVGFQAMLSNTNGYWNSAFGDQSLKSNTTGYNNAALGRYSLRSKTTGYNNTGVGAGSLENNTIGNNNTAVGAGSMLVNVNGHNNTAVGTSTLYNNTVGTNNTVMGFEAGFLNNGSGNVFLGYKAGYNETGSNKLYIANSATNPPLIYGDFTSGYVGIGTNNPQYNLDIFGNGGWPTTATLRVKGGIGSNGRILLADADIAHGVTDWIQTDVFGNITANSDFGGLAVQGCSASNSESGIQLWGIIGSEDPVDTKAAIQMSSYKKNGTGLQVLGATETLFGIKNGFNANNFVVLGNGNVGIGTITPSSKLEVNGQVKITGGTPGVGKVLTSDATGLASWENQESKAYGMVYRSTAFDIPVISIWTDLPLDGGETNLVNVAHSTTINPERVTVNVSGTYLIQYIVHYRRQNFPHHGVARLIKNGTDELVGSYTVASPISGDGNEEDPLSTQIITTLSANDYINIQVATNYNVVNEVDSYYGPDLPTPTTNLSVSITIVKIGN